VQFPPLSLSPIIFALIQVLSEIDFSNIIDNPPRASRVTKLWHDYADLYRIYSAENPDSASYNCKFAAFMELFCSGPRPATASSSSSSSSASHGSRGPVTRRRVASSALQPNTAQFDAEQSQNAPLYPHSHCTPYLHALAHIQFILPHRSMKPFSCSSLEKRNHLNTMDFFRSTTLNGFGRNSLSQILTRELVLFCWDGGSPAPVSTAPSAAINA
jgi:hypothetical protein